MPDNAWNERDYGYTYPTANGKELDLRPGSPLHEKIVEDVTEKANIARSHGQTARAEWRENDSLLSAYATYESSDDKKTRLADPRKPVNIVVPFSRAILEIFQTYMTSTFLADDIYRYTGVGGSRSMAKAMLLEKLVNMQSHWFRHPLQHMMCYRDLFSYGVGAMAPVWKKKKRVNPIDTEVTSVLKAELGDFMPEAQIGEFIRRFSETVICEGSALRNLDPYTLLLDPNVAVNDFQEGEFVGYVRKGTALHQLADENDPEERMFNGKYLREYVRAGNTGYSAAWRDGITREEKHSNTTWDYLSRSEKTNYNCHYIHMFRRIIPSDFDLPGDDPEVWLFTVAADSVVVQADRLELDHGQYPMVIGAPTTTGYDVWPVSGLSATVGMQKTADFFINTFIRAERKSLNGMTIFDPSAIEPKDMMNPHDGMMVRLRKSVYGAGDIKSYVHQLSDNNTTGQHVQHAVQFYELMNSVLGTQNVLSGDMSRMPDRPTAAGLQTANQNAMSRLQTSAQIITEQMYYDLSMQLAYNTLQFMGQDVAIDIVGPKFDEKVRRDLGLSPDIDTMLVSPGDLDASFDVMPMNRMKHLANMQGINSVLERMLSSPEMLMDIFSKYDASGIFGYAATKLGFDNIHEFLREGGDVQATVMPDQQFQQGVEQGNLVQ